MLLMTSTYPTPADTVEVETEVKKSRFIARATKVRSREGEKPRRGVGLCPTSKTRLPGRPPPLLGLSPG